MKDATEFGAIGLGRIGGGLALHGASELSARYGCTSCADLWLQQDEAPTQGGE